MSKRTTAKQLAGLVLEADKPGVLEAEIVRLRSTIQRVIVWLEGLAKQSDQQAKNSARFQSLADACKADAKNYRATADSLRKALAE